MSIASSTATPEELQLAVRTYSGNWRDSAINPRYGEVSPTPEQAVAAAPYSGVDPDDVGLYCRAAWQTAADTLLDDIDYAAEREEDDLAVARMSQVDDLARLVEAACGVTLRCAAGGSWYGIYRRQGPSLKIRVSDHKQVPGGGWSEARQEQMGDADCSFEISRDWTRAEIRAAVARAVMDFRQGAKE